MRRATLVFKHDGGRTEVWRVKRHTLLLLRCQSTALKVLLKWGPKGNFAHNRREENTEYVCIGSWEERIVLYVLYLVHICIQRKKRVLLYFILLYKLVGLFMALKYSYTNANAMLALEH